MTFFFTSAPAFMQRHPQSVGSKNQNSVRARFSRHSFAHEKTQQGAEHLWTDGTLLTIERQLLHQARFSKRPL